MPRTIDGYRLLRALEGAGEPHVFIAHDLDLERAILMHFAADPDQPVEDRAREEDAIRTLAAIEHPNLAAIHRVARWREHPYAISYYPRGDRFGASGVTNRDTLLDAARSVADVLRAMHGQDIFHGAISPATVVLAGAETFVLRSGFAARGSAKRMKEDVAALLRLLGAAPIPAAPAGEGGAGALLSPELDRWTASARELGADFDPPPLSELIAAIDRARGETTAGASAIDPYRGLLPFGLENRALFFGRKRETWQIVARLRTEARVVIAGPSGTGKSSLLRAGVAPELERGAIAERERWISVLFSPGIHPLESLAGALARAFPGDAPRADRLRADPMGVRHWVEHRTARGVSIAVDQLEEVFTLAGEEERAAFFRALAPLAFLIPGVRVIASLRSDFVGALLERTDTGGDLSRALFLLGPMQDAELREAIVEPARALGFEHESAAMVDRLVEESRGAGGLAPLSFALAELWARRDAEKRVLPEAALNAIGGAAGALAEHAEHVLASLSATEQSEARRILLRLLMPGGTRRAETEASLGVADSPPARRALEALVSGRLVVAGRAEESAAVFELAHETLAQAWPRFRAWIEEASETHRAAARLADAVEDWIRLGRAREVLWSTRALAEADREEVLELAARRLEGAAAAVEASEVRAFVKESKRRAARQRIAQRMLLPAALLALAGFAALTWWLSGRQAREQLSTLVRERAAELELADGETEAAQALESRALAAFDRGEPEEAEPLWSEARARAAAADDRRRKILEAIDGALAGAPDQPEAKALAVHALLGRIEWAEHGRDAPLSRALLSSLARHDEAAAAERARRPGRLDSVTEPADAHLEVEKIGGDILPPWTAVPSDRAMELAPGAYLVRTSAPGYEPVQTSVAIARGETTRLHLALPRAGTIPEGFAYVPGGSFRYGAREDEETRRLLEAEPEHALSLSGFLIARHETTAAELRAFDPGYPAGDDELPARGLTWDQATAYAAWLDSSGRRPGARLCSEREWERAARGGDGRRYPHGDAIAAGDACARDPHGPERTGGPCPAGAHPRSRSVFGVDDLAGNVWEWTRDPPSRAQPLYGVLRGGSWADEVGSPWLFASNRGLRPKSAASQLFGARICVDLPAELAERDRR